MSQYVPGRFRLEDLSGEGLDRMIWYAPTLGLVYLRNPKVACSTIQKSLWLAEEPSSFTGKPHLRSVGPFNRALRQAIRNPRCLEQATAFSVVRNPFSRLVSAYLDKVVVADDLQVWKTIRHRLRISREAQPSLADLLERMLEDDNPMSIDHHLRPQHINVLHGIAPLGFVGYFEHFGDATDFLQSKGCEIALHHRHATEANKRVRELFDDRAWQLAIEYYRLDFEIFGYGESLENMNPVSPVHTTSGSMGEFAAELSRVLSS